MIVSDLTCSGHAQKTICLLTVLALGITAVARAQSTVAPCSSSADTVGFNQLLRDIENSGLIQALPANLRVLPFEIVTAAENTELSKMFDELGYETILKVLDGKQQPVLRATHTNSFNNLNS